MTVYVFLIQARPLKTDVYSNDKYSNRPMIRMNECSVKLIS